MPNYPTLKSKSIKYDSPSGKVIIGKYIPPFEKNDIGFGFKGVILEDHASGKIQCYSCGKWFENLSTHIFFAHQLTASDYKRKFGLLQSTALKSKKMRLDQSKVMIKMRKSDAKHRYKFEKNNVFAGNRKDKPKAVESQNKFGVCDLQIMERLTDLAKDLKKTPTLIDIKERYGDGLIAIMSKRYGSYIKYCKDIGLDPNFSNFNPKYSKEYFIEKMLSNEASIRIFTENELRALYKYFKSQSELKENVKQIMEQEMIAQ